MRSALAGSLLVALLATACATAGPGPGPLAVSGGPPIAAVAEAEEAALAGRIEPFEDPLLAEYLATIADRLASADERESGALPITITVVRDPSIGALALPTGRIYLHTGLLSRVANEAQLATVLARELTHVRRLQGATILVEPSAVDEALARIAPGIVAGLSAADEAGTSPLTAMASAILGKRLPLAYTGAMTGHGRALERDADAGALERLVRAAYDPKEAPRVFERLRREARRGGAAERFFLGTDAALAQRIDVMTRLVTTTFSVAAGVPDTVRETADFEAALTPLVRENARLELRAGRLRAAQEQLDRVLAQAPGDAVAHLYSGDLLRLRAQRARSVADRDELARQALTMYERSASLDPGLAEVPRQIGLLYYQQGRYDRAREAFERYVARNPDAPDAARVREYVLALSR